MSRHVLKIDDLSAGDIIEILDLSQVSPSQQLLANKGAALLFEHPSNRTRNAAEMAVVQLGGHPVSIRGEEVGIDRRETAEDIARTLGSFHALIGARVADHHVLERMAGALDRGGYEVPVVNLLSNVEHPSQALADLLTIRQHFGQLEGKVVAYIGDANNVCRSLAKACVLVGVTIRIASPDGFALAEDECVAIGALGRGSVELGSPAEVSAGADVLYTDVWVSMGEEGAKEKREAFAGFTIDDELVNRANPDAIVLHCLPAHRGEEITDAVIESQTSQIWLQAENRMHSLRGLFSFVCRSSLADSVPGLGLGTYRQGPQS